MGSEKNIQIPSLFEELNALGSLTSADIQCTRDGFYAVTRSIADILQKHGITTYFNEQNQERFCDRFFDDWYLYAVQQDQNTVYGLFKMREQEGDAASGIPADADTPGVTVSFISFSAQMLITCIRDASQLNRKALAMEINRVVAQRGQRHDKVFKQYFIRTEAEGPYLIAQLYVSYLASLAQDGILDVPRYYAQLYQKSLKPGASRKTSRIPSFLVSNNQAAGYAVCDHSHIFIGNPSALTQQEKQAILATHTGNVTFHSFAAEVQYHARFLVWYAMIPLPFVGGSAYESAIRADMTIQDKEFEGPAPFYRLESKCVKRQQKYHGLQDTE